MAIAIAGHGHLAVLRIDLSDAASVQGNQRASGTAGVPQHIMAVLAKWRTFVGTRLFDLVS